MEFCRMLLLSFFCQKVELSWFVPSLLLAYMYNHGLQIYWSLIPLFEVQQHQCLPTGGDFSSNYFLLTALHAVEIVRLSIRRQLSLLIFFISPWIRRRFVCGFELYRRWVIVETTFWSHSTEKQFQVVFTQSDFWYIAQIICSCDVIVKYTGWIFIHQPNFF